MKFRCPNVQSMCRGRSGHKQTAFSWTGPVQQSIFMGNVGRCHRYFSRWSPPLSTQSASIPSSLTWGRSQGPSQVSGGIILSVGPFFGERPMLDTVVPVSSSTSLPGKDHSVSVSRPTSSLENSTPRQKDLRRLGTLVILQFRLHTVKVSDDSSRRGTQSLLRTRWKVLGTRVTTGLCKWRVNFNSLVLWSQLMRLENEYIWNPYFDIILCFTIVILYLIWCNFDSGRKVIPVSSELVVVIRWIELNVNILWGKCSSYLCQWFYFSSLVCFFVFISF